MRSVFLLTAALAVLATGCSMPTDTAETANRPAITLPEAPLAQRIDKVTEQVGRTRTDPYAWLRDDNWQEVMRDPSVLNPDIRAYLEAENAFTKAGLEDNTTALTDALFTEMRGRIKEDDSSVPAKDGPWAYYTRYREGGEYPIFARKAWDAATNAPTGEETILLDGDAMGKDEAYFAFSSYEQSPNHRYIAYAVDTKGSEFYTLRILDTTTGETLPDVIEGTYGDFEWADDQTLFWVWRDDNNRPARIYRHTLGQDGSTLVYEETDPGYFLGVGKTEDGSHILLAANNHTTTEYRYIPTATPGAEPRLIAAREPGTEYTPTIWNGQWLFQTNLEWSKDYKIMTAPLNDPARETWTDLVPHRPGTLVLSMIATKNYLVRLERENGLPRLIVRNVDGEEHAISFTEAAYALGASSGFEYDTNIVRFTYSSPATPNQTYDYDMATRERVLRKTQEVPSGHNPDDYVVERIEAASWDGAMVPVTILRRKDTPVDGSAPLLLYGYGSYGITIPADFRTTRLSLVDRGFIYAIAHIRGGMAKGYAWYEDGKLDKKENTFKDFVAAGRELVRQGYGSEGRVVGMGGSAGGLLMGAAVNMDPTLFGGIIAAVPFVDVINTMSDTELPLTPPEWPEWGNPITSAADYDQIMAYSPYDNVADRPYPPMLITGGLTDPRVTYWEPAKWAAKLRHDAPKGGPYFLRINMDSGHGGASGRFEGLKETALEFAFALAVVGHPDAPVIANVRDAKVVEGGE
jgi:oligopeptidase B